MNRSPESKTGSAGRAAALAATVLVIVAAAWLLRPQGDATADSSPEEVVARMLAAEQAGDVDAYLACFGEQQYERLESRIAQNSRERVAADLKGQAADLTGQVTSEVEIGDEGEASLVLERVYRGHNELQQVQLRRIGGRWKIVAVTPIDRFAPPIPYGTPVHDLPDDLQPSDEGGRADANGD